MILLVSLIVLKELTKVYSNWVKYETSYMSDEKKLVVEMMERLKLHLKDKSVPIVTYAELKKEKEESKRKIR